jgi:hypothetical protein
MQRANPQLSALALLVQRFGKQIPGGYEVHVSALEMTTMSPHGIFQEVPDADGRGVRWQYFPNHVIDIEGGTVPDEKPAAQLPEKTDSDRPV